MNKVEISKPKAWFVPVWTTRLGAGEPMLVGYVAGFEDAAEAVEAVKRHLGSLEGDDVREPSRLSDSAVTALGVKPGNVWML